MTETIDRVGPARLRSVRMYDDTWDAMEAREHGLSSSPSQFTRDMAEAGLSKARCYRCMEPVDVEYGDLTGKPLAQWVELAGKVVTAQHRHGHHPVTIGTTAPGDAGAAMATLATLTGQLDETHAALEAAVSRAARAESALARTEAKAQVLFDRLEAAKRRGQNRRAAEADKGRAARQAQASRRGRDRQIADAALAGESQASIAEKFGLTQQRVGQIVRKVQSGAVPAPAAVFLEPGGKAAVTPVPQARDHGKQERAPR